MTVSTKNSVAKDLGQVLDLAGYLASINSELNGQMGALFRGHRDEAWKLIPSVARQARRCTLEREKVMLAEFKLRALPYVETALVNDVDWLAVAQHHGMPTRLLDWSGHALAALWFAVNEPATEAGKGTKSAARVWMLSYDDDAVALESERADPFDIERTVLVRARHVSRRITAQDGWFTLHRGRYQNKGERTFVPLDRNMQFKDRLSFVTIPSSAFGTMRLQLSTSGITSASLFPDLAGVANYVTWKNFCPPDETVLRFQWLL